MLVPCLALLLPLVVAPDILPPGHKDVRHELILQWSDDLPAQRFVAFPTRGMHVPHEIERGVPFTFSVKYSTRIYAVPTDAELPEEREEFRASGWPSAPPPAREVPSVPVTSPVARVETRSRIIGVTAAGIEYASTTTMRFGADGGPLGARLWIPLAVLCATGAGLAAVLGRRRRLAAEGGGEA